MNRKIKKEDWQSFLNPDYNSLFDPMLMKGMSEAANRLKKAYNNKEVIGIFGDYDADGIPGVALLYEFLILTGLEVHVYIPGREQGYGLNTEGIDVLKKTGATLLVTIDLGIRNANEIDYAKKEGLEVIVLDHHEVVGELPRAIIINPKQPGDKYPFEELSATGVVFKFIQAINQKFHKVSDNYLKWALDLVAIATICDVVPLISENRIFAKFGLIVLGKSRRLGLKALYQTAAILPENLGVYAVGFQIGPRLNAPGRMDHASASFYLLTSKDEKEANELAKKLDRINHERQDELTRVFKEAKTKVTKGNLDRKKVILICGENWPQGIVGLVAGKLMEEFARPVIVCEKKGDKLRGSARSIEAYNMVEALGEAKAYLTRYGGHKKAAGLSLEMEHLEHLYDNLLETAEEKLRDEDLVPKIVVDAKVTAVDLDLKLFDQIKKLEPFGLGNPRPVLMLENASVDNIKTVGKENKHLKLRVEGLSAIGFDLGEMAKSLSASSKVDLVFTLDEDSWDGIRKIQLKVLDLKLSKA